MAKIANTTAEELKPAYESWKNEHVHIVRVGMDRDFADFNRDIECFFRYCEMQANAAEREGFPIIAGDIRDFIKTMKN